MVCSLLPLLDMWDPYLRAAATTTTCSEAVCFHSDIHIKLCLVVPMAGPPFPSQIANKPILYGAGKAQTEIAACNAIQS